MISFALTFACVANVHAADVRAQPDRQDVQRALPVAEADRPPLDPRLPAYVACDTPLSGTITGSAPAILPALALAWIDAFEAIHPDVEIRLPPPWAGPQARLSPGFARFLDGDEDFAFLTREPTRADAARFVVHHDAPPVQVTVARGSFRHFGFVDAVAIVVHRDNPLRSIDLVQLDALLSSTRLRGGPPVRSWGDLGVVADGWKDAPVTVIGAGNDVGDEPAKSAWVRRRVLDAGGREGRWRTDLATAHGEDDIPVVVARDRFALGISAFGHLDAGVHALAIAEDAGGTPVTATQATVQDGRYALARPVHLLRAASSGTARDRLLDAFVRFIRSRDGQRIVHAQGVFTPLTARDIDADDAPSDCTRASTR